MKTAIYIEDGLTQVVLTPEKDSEKKAVELLTSGVGAVYRGSFYENRAGWVRFGHSHQDDESAILVVRKGDELPERYVHLPNAVCGDGPFAETRAEAGLYKADFNAQGAVSIKATNGKMLGVKPGEFTDLGQVVA